MGLFTKPIGQVFYKESTDIQDYISQLEGLLLKATGETKNKIKNKLLQQNMEN